MTPAGSAEIAPADHSAEFRRTYPGDTGDVLLDSIDNNGGLTPNADGTDTAALFDHASAAQVDFPTATPTVRYGCTASGSQGQPGSGRPQGDVRHPDLRNGRRLRRPQRLDAPGQP